MKKMKFILIIMFILQMVSLSQADDIDDFDKMVSEMKPVPRQIDVNIQVVGLKIKKGTKDESQLLQIASVGGGKYSGVQNSNNLGKIFTNVTSGQNAPITSNFNISVNKQERLGMALVNEGRRLEKAGDIRGAILKYQESFKYRYKIDQLIALRVMQLKKKHRIK